MASLPVLTPEIRQEPFITTLELVEKGPDLLKVYHVRV